MSALADMVRVMLERDVPRDVIVTAIEAAERHAENVTRHAISHVTQRDAKEKAAARSKRYRERHKRDGDTKTSRDAPESALTLSEVVSKKEKKVRARHHASRMTLPDDWQPNANHYAAALKLKIPTAAVLEKAEDMRLWARSQGAVKADWDATFHGFLRRDAAKLSGGSHGRGNVIAAADQLVEKLREFERDDDLLPGIRGGEGPPDVRLLPPQRRGGP